MKKSTVLFLLCIWVFNSNAQDTLTVMSYNILNYPTSNPSKADTLKPIIKYVKPDIFMITELVSAAGATTILTDALNVDGVTYYQAANYVNGPDTDNMLYYNSDKLVLYSQHEIPTTLRNISEYVLYYNDPLLTAGSDTIFFYCYMAHLKASTGSSNEQQRDQEAALLKSYMNTRTDIENVFLGGDFNLYSSTEPAYNTILNTGMVPLLDPISSPGAWNSNPSFAGIHTQSTRLGSLPDGGSYGGMDDRFDFIFFNNDLLTGSKKVIYINNTYKAIGNDGNHYNQSINSAPVNTAAPANVIDALYEMSDHLPVTLKAYINPFVGVKETNVDLNWTGYYTNDIFKFRSTKTENKMQVVVYDLLGKTVQKKVFIGQKEFELKLNPLHQGIYFVRVFSGNKQKSYKFVHLKNN